VNDKVSPAQIEAMDKWGVQQEGSYAYLKTIKQPTLVVSGSNDVIMPTINFLHHGAEHPECAASHLSRLPITARSTSISPNSSFVHVSMFLSADERRGM